MDRYDDAYNGTREEEMQEIAKHITLAQTQKGHFRPGLPDFYTLPPTSTTHGVVCGSCGKGKDEHNQNPEYGKFLCLPKPKSYDVPWGDCCFACCNCVASVHWGWSQAVYDVFACAHCKRRKVEQASPAAQYTSFSSKALSAASNNFAATRLLGDGGFGKVYRCELPGTGLEVAIKVVPAGDADAAAHFEKEVKELSMHPHPNFVQLLGAAVDGPSPCLVMKYMKGGSVRSRLATQPPLSWRQRLEAATGAARGLVYLHFTLNKVHRDIKPSWILGPTRQFCATSASSAGRRLSQARPTGQRDPWAQQRS